MSRTCEVLIHDSYVPWFRSEAKSAPTVYGRGYAFMNDVFLSGQALVDGLQATLCQENVEHGIEVAKRTIPAFNGCWALVVQWPNGRTLAMVDRSRSIPLLYARTPNGYVISNTIDGVAARAGDLVIDDVCALEFLLCGYTSGKQTLFETVSQVQPGEIVQFDPMSSSTVLTHVQYFTFFSQRSRDATDSQLMDELEQVFESVFRRCAKALEGRLPIISLSGGFDSRAIACMLRKSGVKRALCYTYGAKGYWEVDAARRVANELGFDWRFVEYDPALWQRSMASQEMREYWRYAFCGTSLPVITPYPALVALQQTGDIKERAVFLTGELGGYWVGWNLCLPRLHAEGDCPPGGYCSPCMRIRNSDVVSAVVSNCLNLWPTRESSWQAGDLARLAENIEAEVRSNDSYGYDDIVNYMEWVMRNRYALWVVNRQRAFEYFGRGFYLPFGDHEFIDFFRALPLALHPQRHFYREFLKERVFPESVRQIPFSAGHRRIKHVKRCVRDYLQLVGLIKHAEHVWRRFRGVSELAADTWFTQGRAPWNMTVDDALSPFSISKHLPENLLEVIKPLLSQPSYAISHYGLFAPAFLAMMYSELGQSHKV